MSESLKYDNGKPDCGLSFGGFAKALIEMAKVSTFGAKKYKPNTWQGIEQSRYVSALYRHLLAWQMGEKVDPESGLNPLAHVLWNAAAILQQELTKTQSDERDYNLGVPKCELGQFIHHPKETLTDKVRNDLLCNNKNFEEYDKALMRIACQGQCSNCDGVGYNEGCMDDDCPTFIANKALEKARNDW